ncbi:hypothetical protein PILCRDRAFT_16683 [Piloderma croceum F 1598]|uniref:Uncharacterized protein n=1 Tax=Piloderma croceum (strain F 1598) TaxID=765440 RepID=A0A0C3EVH8_PILCF|nr:hypothetical protein PILCRDRAFT_16683 [Piloderma croceum F 1598]
MPYKGYTTGPPTIETRTEPDGNFHAAVIVQHMHSHLEFPVQLTFGGINQAKT